MRIDLHLHSTVSDGSLTPSELVQAALSARLDVIALTDHDTAAGVPEAVGAAEGTRLRVIPGMEVSTTIAGSELHILGYGIDIDTAVIQTYMDAAVQRREDRMHGMIDRLRPLGVDVRMDEVKDQAGEDGSVLARPHLARVLVEKGHVRSFREAFDRYLGDHAPAFVPTELLTPRSGIELIHDAGGLAVWAHPPLDLFDELIRDLAEWGLDGIECFRPRNTRAETQLFQTAAEDLDLLVTGGSDWHGPWNGSLGSFHVTENDVGGVVPREWLST